MLIYIPTSGLPRRVDSTRCGGSVQMRDRTVVAGDGGGSTRRTCCQEDCVLVACLKPSGDAVRRCACMQLCTLASELALPRLKLVCMRPLTLKPWSPFCRRARWICSSRRHTEWKHPSLYVNGGAGFGGLAWLLALSAPHPFSSVLSSPDIVLCQHFLFLRDIH